MLLPAELRVFLLALALGACSGPPSRHATAPSPSPSPETPKPPGSTTESTPTGATAAGSPGRDAPAPGSSSAAGSTAQARVSAPLLRLADVQHVVKEPVHSLALDPERGKVAALGSQPWLNEDGTWKPIPLPAKLRAKAGERDEARIHFGRDYQPRIMGTRHGPEGPRQLYLRFRFGSWREEPRELASFAGKPPAAVYGVLGWNDPEVVCKVGEFCLVKQRSGWSKVPLPVEPPGTAVRIDLGTGGAYALLERQLLRLSREHWIPVGKTGPWKGKPGGAWIDQQGGWVSAPDEDALYEHDGSAWRRHPSPVREPRGLWSSGAGDLWVAGRDGAALYDGTKWWRVGAIPGPLAEVLGQAKRIWFGGAGGIWSARRSR